MLKLYDAHGDIWYDIVQHSQKGERDIFRKYQLPKFQKGGVMGGTFVMWIDPPHDEDPKRRIKEIEKAVKQELEDAADILNIVRKYEDFEKGTKEGKINVMMGLEGLSYIGEDIDQINYYYEEFGVRTMMLTWNEENALASGWPGDPERGLTAKGKEAIRRMNELGMVLDVSHINDKGFWDILELSDGHPVIASHSNARAVSPHMRNLSDDMIRALAKTGGVMGMNRADGFIHGSSANIRKSNIPCTLTLRLINLYYSGHTWYALPSSTCCLSPQQIRLIMDWQRNFRQHQDLFPGLPQNERVPLGLIFYNGQ